MPVFLAITWFETCSFFLLKLVIAAVSGFVRKLNQHEPVLYEGDVCSSIFFLLRCSVVALDIQLVLTFHIFPSLVAGLFHVLSGQGHFWQFPRPLQLIVALWPLFY